MMQAFVLFAVNQKVSPAQPSGRSPSSRSLTIPTLSGKAPTAADGCSCGQFSLPVCSMRDTWKQVSGHHWEMTLLHSILGIVKCYFRANCTRRVYWSLLLHSSIRLYLKNGNMKKETREGDPLIYWLSRRGFAVACSTFCAFSSTSYS